MFNMLSQVRIAYEESALSGGAAGDLHGGDRLPWAKTADGDNFAPLRSMDWHLHVYGDAKPATVEEARRRRLPLHELPWNDAAKSAGLSKDAAYLVRPDGYISVAMPDQALDPMFDVLDKMGLRFGAGAASNAQ